METLFSLEFRRFLDDNKISYSLEKDFLYIVKGDFYVKLVPFEDYLSVIRYDSYPRQTLIIHQDRWLCKQKIVKSIILAKVGIVETVFARNCIVEKIDKATAKGFYNTNHLIGGVNAKFNYGLKSKYNGLFVAVASFSLPRVMKREELSLKSYEWVRYANAKGVRVSGGMGKLLTHFVNEVSPEEIMTYCDADWSSGNSYIKLGFTQQPTRKDLDYLVDKNNFERISIKKIRRDLKEISPDFINENYYQLITQGNLKFLKRFLIC
jgi:hypothetical protein